MSRFLLVLLLGLCLAGCESSEEKAAKWIAFCVDGEFTVKQCRVLYAMKESSDDAANAAGVASMNSIIAAGAAVGRR
jgi:hypothetical protein